jgi:hypothetical protein
MVWVMAQQVFDPTPQRRQSAVARGGLVAAMCFQAHQKIQYLLAGNIGQHQTIHSAMSLPRQVLKKQSQGVPIGTDRVRAGSEGLDQVLLKKGLDQR